MYSAGTKTSLKYDIIEFTWGVMMTEKELNGSEHPAKADAMGGECSLQSMRKAVVA